MADLIGLLSPMRLPISPPGRCIQYSNAATLATPLTYRPSRRTAAKLEVLYTRA